MSVEAHARDVDLLASVAPRRWAPAVFGIVPEGARRRRPRDVVRVGFSTLVTVITALGTTEAGTAERRLFDLLASIPSWIRTSAEFSYRIAAIGTVTVVLLALLVTRRFRLLGLVAGAGALG